MAGNGGPLLRLRMAKQLHKTTTGKVIEAILDWCLEFGWSEVLFVYFGKGSLYMVRPW